MPGPTGPSPRLIGLTLASIMFLVFAVVIWRSMGTGVGPGTNQGNLFPDDPSEIPDLSDLEQGASMFVTIVDRDDPTRVAGTLQADQFEPIGGGQRRLVNPDAWVYLRDARRVRITAEEGVVMMPDPNEAPDSGTLEGHVTIRVYEASTSSTQAMNMAIGLHDSPSMTVTFDEPVGFERRYLRLTTEGRFKLDSPRLEFIGHDLTVMLNEIKNRIELIDVRRGERLVLHPAAQDATAMIRSKPADRTPAYALSRVGYSKNVIQQDDAVVEETKPAVPVVKIADEKPYHVQIRDEVLVDVIGTGTLKADALDIWAMLIDGGLSPEAIRQIKFATTPEEDLRQSSSATSSVGIPVGLDPVEPVWFAKTKNMTRVAQVTQATQEEGQVVMTWTGPLVVRPIEDPSATVLATDELAFAFTSSQRVEFEGALQGVHGSADAVHYRATDGILELRGATDSPIELTADEAGTLRAAGLMADLGAGIITIDSAGELVAIQASDAPKARIDWETSARFDLVTTDDGELSGRLQAAKFEGDVLGSRGDAVVEAAMLDATLDREGAVESALRKIVISKGTMRSDSGSLSGDEISIGFVPFSGGASDGGAGGGGVTPVSLDASGAVLGFSEDGRVETALLEAVLVREFDGRTRIQRASAIGETQFVGRDETHASGDRVDLNTDNDTIYIVGDEEGLARAGQGGSVIHGPEIWINTRERSIRVDGEGSFDHDIVAKGSPAGGHLRVTWSQSMRFQDAMGLIECVGDVMAVSTPDAYTIDTLKSERLEIELTPASSMRPHDGSDGSDGSDGGDSVDRELLIVRAFGRAVPGGDSILASVESRSYDPQNPERAIGVVYLEGPQLIADNQRQTLRVPSSGMMVLMDRSGGQQAVADDSASVMPSTTGPGLTRLTWNGSMLFDRAGGAAEVVDGVNIRHKSLTTGNISQIDCDRLDALFSASGVGDDVGAIAMQRADVSGNVRFTDLQRTLLSDYAVYDAIEETLFAFADGDRLVTLRDSNEPTPVSAKTLLWDLKRDLIEIDAPSPVRRVGLDK